MWNLLGAHFDPQALGTAVRARVDLWLLLEEVGEALRVRSREVRTARELHRWKLRLLNASHAARSLRDELRAWLAVPDDDPAGDDCPIKEAARFLTRQWHADRLDDAAARRVGPPVGSGVVEATCLLARRSDQ